MVGAYSSRSRIFAPEKGYVMPLGTETDLTMESPKIMNSGGENTKVLAVLAAEAVG